jgi:alkylation response protein AidB-like acyl-CoA dehydrogenase
MVSRRNVHYEHPAEIWPRGFGFAEEYDVESKFREARLYTVAPISTNLILSYLAGHVLGLPRSY